MKELDYLIRSILIDDVEVLRNEQDALYDKFCHDSAAIQAEINMRIEAARKEGIRA